MEGIHIKRRISRNVRAIGFRGRILKKKKKKEKHYDKRVNGFKVKYKPNEKIEDTERK